MEGRAEIKVGGVPEHFNRPWHMAREQSMWEAANISVKWQNVGGGTGAMMKAVRGGEVDVVIALTEGIVANMLQQNTGAPDDIVIIAPYVTSPLNWAIVTGAQSPHTTLASLASAPLGVSRLGSGSHLMAFLLAEREGWDPASLSFATLKDFTGLRKGVNEGTAGAFLWEHFTTKPYWLASEVAHVGDIPTPWPCFMMAARADWVDSNLPALHAMLGVVRYACHSFKANPGSSVPEVAAHYGLGAGDAAAWFSTVQYAADGTIPTDVLTDVVAALQRVGVLTPEQAGGGAAGKLVHGEFVTLSEGPGAAAGVGGGAPALPPAAPATPHKAGRFILPDSVSPPKAPAGGAGGESIHIGRRRTGSSSSEAWVIYAAGIGFKSQEEYDVWRSKKDAALAAVLGHLDTFGGVPAVGRVP